MKIEQSLYHNRHLVATGADESLPELKIHVTYEPPAYVDKAVVLDRHVMPLLARSSLLRDSLAELVEICKVACNPRGVILRSGKTNQEAVKAAADLLAELESLP